MTRRKIRSRAHPRLQSAPSGWFSGITLGSKGGSCWTAMLMFIPVGSACDLLTRNCSSRCVMSSSWKIVVLESFKTWNRSLKLWWEGMLVIGLSFSVNNRSMCTMMPGFNGYLDPWISSETAFSLRSLSLLDVVSTTDAVAFSKTLV